MKDFCVLAVSDTQLAIGAVVGVALLWLFFRTLRGMAGMFLKIVIIILLVAAAAGIFYMLKTR